MTSWESEATFWIVEHKIVDDIAYGGMLGMWCGAFFIGVVFACIYFKTR